MSLGFACSGLLSFGVLPAHAVDPGLWRLSNVDRIPIDYQQGLAPDGAGSVFWAGASSGVFRGDEQLVEKLNLRQAIPGFVRQADGVEQIGDPTWDPSQGGRILLPLSCGSGGAVIAGCPRAALAVMDRALIWRYRVRLEQADVTNIGWAEASPEGDVVWTSSGRDLLAYSTADIVPAAGSATAMPLRAVRRLRDAAPAGLVTGAAFSGGRLLLASRDAGRSQVWSLDVRDGQSPSTRLEIERTVAGEPEGLGAFDGRGGLLHWVVAPTVAPGQTPTYRAGANALLSFLPAAEAALDLTVAGGSLRAGRPATLTVTVSQRFAGRTRAVHGASVTAAGRGARTDADGQAELRVRPASGGTMRVTARKQELAPDSVDLKVQRAVGRPLTRLPSLVVMAGAASARLTAQRLLDCSGVTGCEAVAPPRPQRCVAIGPARALRIKLLRRPARDVSVLLQGGGDVFASGLAGASGRQGLGWRIGLRGRPAGKGRLEIVAVYPDGTGALFVARTRPGRC